MGILAIFRSELIRTARQPWVFWLRTVYIAVLATMLIIAWGYLASQSTSWQERPLVGQQLFRFLASCEFWLVQALAVLALSGAIAREHLNRTLPILLSTCLSAPGILLGKLLAGMIPVALLVGSGFPLFCLLLLFGGVGWAEVIATTLLTLGMAVLTGSLTLLVSVLCQRMLTVVLVAGGVIGLFLALASASLPLVIKSVHPVYALDRVLIGWAGTMEWLPAVVCAFGLAAVLYAVAVLLLRPVYYVRLEQLGRQKKTVGAAQVIQKRLDAFRRGVNPFAINGLRSFWLEKTSRNWIVIPYALAVCVLLFSSRPQQVFWVPLLLLLSLSASLVIAVQRYTNEYQKGTLAVLCSTPASGRDLFWGGLGRIGYASFHLLLVPAVYFLAAYILGRFAGYRLLLITLGSLTVFYVFLVSLGYVAGLVCKNLWRALLMVGVAVLLIDLLTLALNLFVFSAGDPAAAPQATFLYWLLASWGKIAFMDQVPLGVCLQWALMAFSRLVIAGVLLWWAERNTDRLLGRIS